MLWFSSCFEVNLCDLNIFRHEGLYVKLGLKLLALLTSAPEGGQIHAPVVLLQWKKLQYLLSRVLNDPGESLDMTVKSNTLPLMGTRAGYSVQKQFLQDPC
jgi:hypothetical protein